VKPAPFEYFAPREPEEALELLERWGDEAKVLAGGQSLVPLLNFRLARPKALIDVNHLGALDFLRAEGGGLSLGALTRQRAVERSALVRERNPLLAAALPLVGHFQIRNRGTVGGSLAHADPAAELPAVALALDAELALRSRRGERRLGARDFFLDYMTTALRPDELVVEIRFPAWRAGAGWAIEEIARRHGDFAIAGVAAVLEPTPDGGCRQARIVLFGVGTTPLRMDGAEALLESEGLGEKALAEAARAAAESLDPIGDIHASPAYRKHVSSVLIRRALERAMARAREVA
jgi:carbon-monoxide dehydrogenase medium subunit